MAALIKYDELQKYKVGFPTLVQFKKFLSDNNIRKSRTQTTRQFLLHVKAERIKQKKIRIAYNKRYAVNGPKFPRGGRLPQAPPQPQAPPPPQLPQAPLRHHNILNRETGIGKRMKEIFKIAFKGKAKQYEYKFGGDEIEDSYSIHDLNHLSDNELHLTVNEVIYMYFTMFNEFAENNNNCYIGGQICIKFAQWNTRSDENGRQVNRFSWKYQYTKMMNFKEVTYDDLNIILLNTIGTDMVGYTSYLHSFTFFSISEHQSVEGGCTKNVYSCEKIALDKYSEIQLRCYKSKNENCLFSAINKFFKDKEFNCEGNVFVPDTVRKTLHIELNTPIHNSEIKDIIQYYNQYFNTHFGYILFNESLGTPISMYAVPPKSTYLIENIYDCVIPLFLKENHYYLYNYHGKVQCKECGQRVYPENLNDHICALSVIAFNQHFRNEYLKNMIEHMKNKYGNNNRIIKFVDKGDKSKYLIDLKLCDEDDKKMYYELKYCNKIVTPYYKPQNKKKKDNDEDYEEQNDKLKIQRRIYIDFEAFPNEHDEFISYAFGYYDDTDKIYKSVYHGDELCSVMDSLFKILNSYNEKYPDENIVLIAYNGSNFDFQLILKELVIRNYPIDYNKFIINNGSILAMKFLNFNIFDLCKFLPGYSLKKACEDFSISDENSKGEFNHDKIKSFDDAIMHKDECLEYLKKDVMGMVELFKKFYEVVKKASSRFDLVEKNKIKKMMKENANKIWAQTADELLEDWFEAGFDITHFLTISHCGYDMWRSTLKRNVQIPTHRIHKKFIAPSTFGGRTNPFQRNYQSKHFDEIKTQYDKCLLMHENKINNYKEMIALSTNKKNTKEIRKRLMDECFAELKEKYIEIIKNSDDYIINADVTSLYPAAMAGFLNNQKLWLKGHGWTVPVNKPTYPIGKLNEIENNPRACKDQFEDGKIGIYQIKYKTPKNIRIPILPTASFVGTRRCGIKWSLEDSEGFYTSIDIENAIIVGYKIEFLGDCIYWDNKADLFSEYVNNFIKLKQEAEQIGNDALRNACKLFMNSLYGKTLQKPIISETKIINNFIEFNEFIKTHYLNGVTIINDDKIVVTGDVIDCDDKMTKPSQLGAFVTAYSRRIMLFYIMQMDSTLTKSTFTYTDTDSLHIHKKYIQVLIDKGYYVQKKNAQLGLLTSDIDNNGIILMEQNLGPKSYLYEFLDEEGLFNDTKKTKGIPKKALNKEMFNNASDKFLENIKNQNLLKRLKQANKEYSKDNTYKYDQDILDFEKEYKIYLDKMKKLNNEKQLYEKDKTYKISNESIEFEKYINQYKVEFKIFKKMLYKPTNNVSHFGVTLQSMERTFNKSTWTGWNLIDNEFYPPGYEH